jgi:hypothetical protein
MPLIVMDFCFFLDTSPFLEVNNQSVGVPSTEEKRMMSGTRIRSFGDNAHIIA